MSPRLPAALLLTTFCTLVIELNFTRLVSLLFLPNDAYWVIAIALLGSGIGGAGVAVAAERLTTSGRALLPALMQGIAVAAVLPPLLFRFLQPELEGRYVPENPVPLYLWVSLPCLLTFALSSAFVSLVLMRGREHVGRLYFFDLLGAGLGCGAFHFLLVALGVERSLVAAAGLAAGGSLLVRPPGKSFLPGLVLAGAVVAAGAWAVRGPSPLLPLYGRELRMLHDYRGEDLKLELQRWDPAARIDICSVPGAVVRLPDEARYKLLTQDGGAPSILLGFDRPVEELEFPSRSLLGAAYWHRRAERVLIIGPGGGPDVVVALHYAPASLTVVELNAATIRAVRDDFREFTGNLYERPGVRVVHDDGRHFVRASPEQYDVIQLTGVDTILLTAGGNLSENYLYTLEGFRDYFDHLSPDGVLSITYPHLTRWGVRALAMLLKVMHDAGVEDPGAHVVVSMSGGYVNLLTKRSPFLPDEVEAIAAHFREPMYGLLLPLCYELWGRHLPEGQPSLYVYPPEVLDRKRILHDPFRNRQSPYSDTVARWAAAPDAPAFWEGLGPAMAPAHDDRPFFFLPIDAGKSFAVRIGALAVPTLLFVLGPLWVFRRRGLATEGAPALAIYFAGLGLAFIALEIVLLQRFVLFLGHPALSFSVVLASLLVSTGFGSLLSGRTSGSPLRTLAAGVTAIVVYVPLLLGVVGAAGTALLQYPLPVRLSAVVLATAPLGLAMGTLFPSGIRLLAARAEGFVPWAFGINGSASVLGTLLALLLAIHLGFARLALLAVSIYVLAALAARIASRRLRA